tara:strand:+ start:19 stop:414 length:396 start_codon:yes stop_codon:yes gene_type:complete
MSNKIDIRSLGQNMEKYISLSGEIKRLDKLSRDLKKNKSDIEETIINQLENNKLTNKEFIKGNFKISLQQSKKSDGLNQKFVKNAIEQYFINSYSDRLSEKRCIEKANELFEYVLSLRKTRTHSSLKQIPL